MGTLYLIATPIGNLEDLSARALRLLAEVELIAAEDTRQTRKLLNHFDIHTPLTSYFEHNKLAKVSLILNALERGDVALVSDAGTPALNDPGYELVQEVIAQGHLVSPVPGACAPIAALVASGLPTDQFLYLGYLPRKASERRRRLEEVAHYAYTLIFLETPHRLLAALADIQSVLGNRQIAVARELTKIHEEIFRGEVSAAREHFTQKPPRGEFTLVIAGASKANMPWDDSQIQAAIRAQLAEGRAPAHIARVIAAQANWPRRKVYKMIMAVLDAEA